jgi:dihydrofolate reductase
MSLDGLIAGPGGDMSWLSEHLGPNPTADALVPRIGALLVGARTYWGDDPNRGTDSEGAFGGAWSGPQVVLTSSPPAEPVPDTTFVGDLHEAVALASQAAGDRYVAVLGAQTARSCLDAGLLDEVLVFVVPVLLGDGTRLFEQAGGTSVRLEQVEVVPMPHCTALWLRVVR